MLLYGIRGQTHPGSLPTAAHASTGIQRGAQKGCCHGGCPGRICAQDYDPIAASHPPFTPVGLQTLVHGDERLRLIASHHHLLLYPAEPEVDILQRQQPARGEQRGHAGASASRRQRRGDPVRAPVAAARCPAVRRVHTGVEAWESEASALPTSGPLPCFWGGRGWAVVPALYKLKVEQMRYRISSFKPLVPVCVSLFSSPQSWQSTLCTSACSSLPASPL